MEALTHLMLDEILQRMADGEVLYCNEGDGVYQRCAACDYEGWKRRFRSVLSLDARRTYFCDQCKPGVAA